MLFIGVVWLGVFFWWGSNWIRTSGQYSARYAFWVSISLLAAVHFALQLAIQILYIHNPHQPSWLGVLGFPRKISLQKLQVHANGGNPMGSNMPARCWRLKPQRRHSWCSCCLHVVATVMHADRAPVRTGRQAYHSSKSRACCLAGAVARSALRFCQHRAGRRTRCLARRLRPPPALRPAQRAAHLWPPRAVPYRRCGASHHRRHPRVRVRGSSVRHLGYHAQCGARGRAVRLRMGMGDARTCGDRADAQAASAPSRGNRADTVDGRAAHHRVRGADPPGSPRRGGRAAGVAQSGCLLDTADSATSDATRSACGVACCPLPGTSRFALYARPRDARLAAAARGVRCSRRGHGSAAR